MSAQVTEYKGTKILMLQGKNFNLPLGLAKCKLVTEHSTEIAQFIVENSKTEETKNA